MRTSFPAHLEPSHAAFVRLLFGGFGWVLLCAVPVLAVPGAMPQDDGTGTVEQPFPRQQPVPGEAERLWNLAQEPSDSALLTSDDTFALHRLVADWAASWSQQAAERYLGHYSERFVPTGRYSGTSREEWARDRRAKLAQPSSIRVDISDLLVDLESERVARVFFGQSYSSDRFSDFVEKRLLVEREPEGWKIVREEVVER